IFWLFATVAGAQGAPQPTEWTAVTSAIGRAGAAQPDGKRVKRAVIGALALIGRTDVPPRVLAALIMLPVLTVINDFIGILGGNVIAKFYLGIPSPLYWKPVFEQMLSGGFTLHSIPNDCIQALAKSFGFDACTSLVGHYY